MSTRQQLVGQIQRPGQRPENINLVVNDLASVIETVGVKGTTTTINTDATRTVDDDFTVFIDADTWYRYELFLRVFTTSATPDFQYSFNSPGTFTGDLREHSTNAAGTVIEDVRAWSETPTIAIAASSTTIITLTGTVTSDTAGSMEFLWAQAVSDATDISVFNGSFVRVTKLE